MDSPYNIWIQTLSITLGIGWIMAGISDVSRLAVSYIWPDNNLARTVSLELLISNVDLFHPLFGQLT